jgi:hypothetical protein
MPEHLIKKVDFMLIDVFLVLYPAHDEVAFGGQFTQFLGSVLCLINIVYFVLES